MAKYHIVYFAYGSENSLRQINMHVLQINQTFYLNHFLYSDAISVVVVQSLSHIWLFATLWTVARLLYPGDFPGKNTGVGCHLPPGDLPDPGIEPASPALQADSLPLSHWGGP